MCITKGIIPPILELLREKRVLSIIIPSLRVLGNIATGTEQQVEVLLQAHPVDTFCLLLHEKNKSVRREVCWLLSNITVGPVRHTL